MTTIKLLFALTLLAGSQWALAHSSEAPLLLVAGLQTTLKSPVEPCSNTLECIRVANRGMLEVQYSLDKGELIITPVKNGETTITLRDVKGDVAMVYNVMVVNRNLPRMEKELKELLKNMKGVDAKIVGDQVIVDGEADSIAEMNRIYSIVAAEPYLSNTLILAQLGTAGLQKLAKQIEEEAGVSTLKVRVLSGGFAVEGSVPSEAKLNLIKEKIIFQLREYVFFRPNVTNSPQNGEAMRSKYKGPVFYNVAIKP